MQYGKILPARFLARPNRFVARVEAEGQELVCHVKNYRALPGAAGARGHRVAGGEPQSQPENQV